MIETLALTAIPIGATLASLASRALTRGTVPADQVNRAAVEWFIRGKLPAFPPEVSAQIGSDAYDPFCEQCVEGLVDPQVSARLVAQYLSGNLEAEQLDKALDIRDPAKHALMLKTELTTLNDRFRSRLNLTDKPGGYAIVQPGEAVIRRQTRAERREVRAEKARAMIVEGDRQWREERDAFLAAGYVWDRALHKFVPHPGKPASVTQRTHERLEAV